jgi:hypothetical protein
LGLLEKKGFRVVCVESMDGFEDVDAKFTFGRHGGGARYWE